MAARFELSLATSQVAAEDEMTSSTSAYSSSGPSPTATGESSSSPPLSHVMYQMSVLALADDQTTLTAGGIPLSTKGAGSDSGTESVDNALDQNTPTAGNIANGSSALEIANGPWYFEVAGAGEDGPLSAMRGARNVTETVVVPSSEHVAEIVGRQGCKIKALRAKTNTYIKTPVRGEDPVFVVTGRPEDVEVAKQEIEQAADHFTQIRASRRHSQGSQPAPGHITAYVRVPYRVVGLVVGPKGATIKRIQQDTHTYIITPSREREPIFEVTGLPANVDNARVQIEEHILQRTGVRPSTEFSNDVSAAALAALQQQQHRAKDVPEPNNNTTLLSNQPTNAEMTAYLVANGLAQPNSLKQAHSQSVGSSPPPSFTVAPTNNNSLGYNPAWSSVYLNGHTTVPSNNLYPAWSLVDHQNHQNVYTNGMKLASSQMQPLDACQQDEGIGGSYPNNSWAAYHALWQNQQHQPATNVVPPSPMTGDPPTHLIMSSIWSDLENPSD